MGNEVVDREKFKETPVRSREEWKEVLTKKEEPKAENAVQKMKESDTMKNIREAAKERKRIEIRKAFGLRTQGGAREQRAPSRPQIIVVGQNGAVRQRYAPQAREREPEHGGIAAGGFHGGMLGGSERRDSGLGEIGMFAGPPKGKKARGRSGLGGSW